MARVRLSDAAKSDLRTIYRFGVHQFGLPQSDRYAAMLGNAMKTLGEFPDSGSRREGVVQPIRVKPAGSHIIVYAADPDGVHILRVRHASEDWTSRPTGNTP